MNWQYDPSADVFVHRNGHEVDATLCKTPKQILWNLSHLIEACGWVTNEDFGELVRLMFDKKMDGTKVH